MKAKINKIVQETHDTKSFTFLLDSSMTYKTSQFVNIKLDAEVPQRPFSIACPPSKNEMMITARIVPEGRFTPYLNKLKVGDEVEIDGPYGKFVYESGKTTLLGAGVGIAPLRGILHCALADNQNIELFYTDKTEEDLIYKKEFEDLRDSRKIKLNFVLTREEDSHLAGRLDQRYLRNKIKSKTGNFYICGAPKFVEQTVIALKRIGVTEEQIKLERF